MPTQLLLCSEYGRVQVHGWNITPTESQNLNSNSSGRRFQGLGPTHLPKFGTTQVIKHHPMIKAINSHKKIGDIW